MKAQRTAALARRRQTEDASRLTDRDAIRLVDQASFGVRPEEMTSVKTLGYRAWVNDQLTKTCTSSLTTGQIEGQIGQPQLAWYGRAIMADGAQLHARAIHALQNFIVMNVQTAGAYWDDGFKYVDILNRNAFGNFRTLLFEVSTSWMMGKWLTFFGNKKAANGVQPDENYAREVMQLFSIGLWELNLDGTRVKAKELLISDPRYIANSDADVPTYTLADVRGLARVWTGWGPRSGTNFNDMTVPNESWQAGFNEAFHETGEKSFLRTTIPAGTLGVPTMNLAIDTLFAQPSLPPFFCKQMIQRFVTSNPSPAYVARVASVFIDNGSGVRGDLKSVWRAILLDAEARSIYEAAKPTYGKLREGFIDILGAVRSYSETTVPTYVQAGLNEAGNYGYTYSPFNQSTVFNNFKPTYQPSADFILNGRVAPEMEAHGENVAIKRLSGPDQLFAVTQKLATNNATTDLFLNLDPALLLKNDPAALVDYVCKFANVTLSDARRTSLINFATGLSASDTGVNGAAYVGHGRTQAMSYRASQVLNAVYMSPERIVQK